MRPPLPPYLDGLLAAYRAGQTGRDLHLGYWDDPPDLAKPCTHAEFLAAQARLTERVVTLARPQPGQRVLDIACGLGGTLAAVAARVPDVALVGLNIDRRQLALCRDIAPPTDGTLSLVEADACALPFAAAGFDLAFCIEAMFHFRSRRTFLDETARVLRPGGRLVVTDILLHHPGNRAPWPGAAMTAALRRDYGPWPEPWVEAASLARWGADAGLDLADMADWTAATLPSYRVTAPESPRLPADPEAGQVLRWLHREGRLDYRLFSFRRR